jgi:hypothetical protein
MIAGAWVAGGFGLLAGAYLLFRFGFVWPRILQESKRLKSNVPNKRSFAQFAAVTARLDETEHRGDAALSLRDESAKLYDEVIAANGVLDAKATTILGFVGGGASLYALAVESKAATNAHASPLLAMGVFFFVLSLLACLGCMFTRFRGGLPELRDLAVPATLNDASMTASRVAAFLFVLKQDRHDDNLWINSYKTMYVEAAHTLFAFGAIAIVLNYLVLANAGGTGGENSSGRCVVISKGNSITYDCTTKGGSHGP